MQLNFKQARSNNNQKVRMPVTELNSIVKIAFLMRKYWEKNSVCY